MRCPLTAEAVARFYVECSAPRSDKRLTVAMNLVLIEVRKVS